MRIHRPTQSCIAASLLALACDHGAAEPVAEPPSDTATPPSAPTATPIAGDARPPTAATAALPKANSNAKVPADAPRFVTVATRPEGNNAGELRLFAIDGAAFLGAGSALMRLHADGTLEHERGWARGLDDGISMELDEIGSGMSWFDTEALGGSWPEDTILALRPQSGSRGSDDAPLVYRRSNAVWTQIRTREKVFDWYPRTFGRWKDGSLLALKAFQPRYADPGSAEDGPPARQVAASARAIAKQKRLVVLRGTPKAPAFGARAVQAFASLPSGEIVAAIAKGEGVVMLHHDESGAPDRELAVPGRGPLASEPMQLAARAADDAWLLGRPPWRTDDAPPLPGEGAYLAHFDGRAWSEIATECATDPRGLALDREGSAYFICNLRIDKDRQPDVLFRVRGGVLEELPLAAEPREVLPLAADDIWVVHYGNGPTELFHSSAAPREQLIPTTIQGAHEILEWAAPHPLGESCHIAWIPLAADADRTKLVQLLDGIDSSNAGVHPEIVDARVRGEAKVGVMARVFEKGVVARIEKLRKLLGDAAGPATCNEYPPLTGDTHD